MRPVGHYSSLSYPDTRRSVDRATVQTRLLDKEGMGGSGGVRGLLGFQTYTHPYVTVRNRDLGLT